MYAAYILYFTLLCCPWRRNLFWTPNCRQYSHITWIMMLALSLVHFHLTAFTCILVAVTCLTIGSHFLTFIASVHLVWLQIIAYIMEMIRLAKQRLLFWFARVSSLNYYPLWQWKLILQALTAWTLQQPNQWHIGAKLRCNLEQGSSRMWWSCWLFQILQNLSYPDKEHTRWAPH